MGNNNCRVGRQKSENVRLDAPRSEGQKIAILPGQNSWFDHPFAAQKNSTRETSFLKLDEQEKHGRKKRKRSCYICQPIDPIVESNRIFHPNNPKGKIIEIIQQNISLHLILPNIISQTLIKIIIRQKTLGYRKILIFTSSHPSNNRNNRKPPPPVAAAPSPKQLEFSRAACAAEAAALQAAAATSTW